LTSAGAAAWLARRLRFALVLLAGASVCAAAASLHWFLELFSHFTPHYALGALALAAVFLFLKAPRWAAAGAVVAGANIVLIAYNFVPPATADRNAAGARLAILHLNVGFRNAQPRLAVDYMLAHAQRFDVVVLIETPPQWAAELKRLDKAYPHSVRVLEDSPWGMAIFSREKPLENAIVAAPDGGTHSETRIAVAGRGRPVAIYGIHPPPPISQALADARNANLLGLAETIRRRRDETAIVVGDFNLTPWSPYFRAFAQASGLRPARSSAFAPSTWPTPVAGLQLGIAIDHAFVGADASLVAHEVGPDLGSDHLPVGVVLALR
jgi:endonuclease/exonuclease/phosphatase (EEP) superfamily protein YafD